MKYIQGLIIFGASGSIDLSGATIVAAADVRVMVVSEYQAEVENDEVLATVEADEITATVESEVTAEVECP